MSREYTFGGALQTISIESGPSALITRARRSLRSSLSPLACADTAARIVSATTRTLRRSVFVMTIINSRSIDVDHLARIHPVVGIERALHRAHHLESLAVLRF